MLWVLVWVCCCVDEGVDVGCVFVYVDGLVLLCGCCVDDWFVWYVMGSVVCVVECDCWVSWID